MFDDLDETIRQLLIAEMPLKNGEVEISFEQPKREWSARLNRPTVNLFLYDVRENSVLRQHQWEQLSGNGDGIAHLKRLPFRLDCTYMLTTWASVPEDEHRLLTRCLLALFRFPILPDDRLVGSLRNPPFDIQTHLASHEKLTNPAEVWSSLDNEIRPSISYQITLALDPWKEITSPVVRTRTMQTGQARELPPSNHNRAAGNEQMKRSQGLTIMDDTRSEMDNISGKITSAGRAGTPLADVEVAIKKTGLSTITNADGRFTLRSLPPGEYILVAQHAKGKPKEKKISVPEKEGNYDMEI